MTLRCTRPVDAAIVQRSNRLLRESGPCVLSANMVSCTATSTTTAPSSVSNALQAWNT